MTDPASATEQTEQRAASSIIAPAPAAANTASGKLFGNITHALSDSDLASLPVAKLILDRMYTAEMQREEFKAYVPLYHAADKNVAVLKEKLNTSTMVDIFYGTGLALGGAAAGFAPYFWDKDRMAPGIICISFAVVLIVLSVVVRIYGPKK